MTNIHNQITELSIRRPKLEPYEHLGAGPCGGLLTPNLVALVLPAYWRLRYRYSYLRRRPLPQQTSHLAENPPLRSSEDLVAQCLTRITSRSGCLPNVASAQADEPIAQFLSHKFRVGLVGADESPALLIVLVGVVAIG